MAQTFSTVKLPSPLVDEARREAELLHRSIGGQIEHWARLGRAVENAEGFSIARVRQAIAGELKIDELADAEQDAFFADLGAGFDAPSPEFTAGYARLGEQSRAARARRRKAGTAKKSAA
jgi:ParD-like antitoxin of type II bacterial toxin-antitoxin system